MSKTVLITGASSGIGRATAEYFAEKDWNVVATMRTPDKEKELNKLENVLVTRLDVTDVDSIEAAIKEGMDEFEQIDVVVNNAGYGAFGPLETFKRESVVRQFDTNVMGVLDVSRAIIPHFRENKSGVLINISSIGGRMALPLGSLYHGTKFAVEGISEGLWYEFEQIGAQVKLVEPGAIRTDFAGRSFDFQNDESIKEYQGMVGKITGAFESFMQNASEPKVVAEVIYTAATDGTDQLRYTAGEDAKEFMAGRDQADDATFMAGIKQQFDL